MSSETVLSWGSGGWTLGVISSHTVGDGLQDDFADSPMFLDGTEFERSAKPTFILVPFILMTQSSSAPANFTGQTGIFSP